MPTSLSGFIENMRETSNDKRRSIKNYVKNVSQNSDKITDFYNVTKHGEIYHELMSLCTSLHCYIEYLFLKILSNQYNESQLIRNIFKRLFSPTKIFSIRILNIRNNNITDHLLSQKSETLTRRTVRNAGDLTDTAELQLLKSHKDIALKP